MSGRHSISQSFDHKNIVIQVIHSYFHKFSHKITLSQQKQKVDADMPRNS